MNTTDWHAIVEKDDAKHEHIHQIFESLDAAIAWSRQISDLLGGRPGTFKATACPICRERRLSTMRAQNL
jgi:hypothetical protein